MCGGVVLPREEGQGHSELEIARVGGNEEDEVSVGRAVGGQERPQMGEGSGRVELKVGSRPDLSRL